MNNSKVIIDIQDFQHRIICNFLDDISIELLNASRLRFQGSGYYSVDFGINRIEGGMDKKTLEILYGGKQDFRSVTKKLDVFLRNLGFDDIFWKRDIEYATLSSNDLNVVLRESRETPVKPLPVFSGRKDPTNIAMTIDYRKELLNTIDDFLNK